MNFKTVSSILGTAWLISDDFVQANLGLVFKMLNGEAVTFQAGEDKEDEKDNLPRAIVIGAGAPGRAAAALAGVYGVKPHTTLEKLPQGSIAMVDIIGPVTKYGGACSYGSVDKADLMTRLGDNPNVAGIILNIDSPGGQAAGTSMMADAIKAAGQKKPVVAMINDGIAASAAMWMASAASEIYVTKPTDQVGSIGVYTTLADWYNYAEKQGLKVRDIYAPQSTDKNGTTRQALAGNEEPLKKDLAHLADTFISTIQANRGSKLTTDEWNTGKMFEAQNAQRVGLIDGLKPFPQVVQRVQQLIDKKSSIKQNHMTAFSKTIAITGTEGFAVVDGGFLAEESQLNAIESHIATQETTIAERDATIQGLQNQVAERDATIQGLQSNDQAQTITDLQNQVTNLTAENEKLKGSPAGMFSSTKKIGDNLDTANNPATKYQTSIDIEKAERQAILNR